MMAIYKYIFFILGITLLASCSTDVAGGVTEETNSIAGVMSSTNKTAAKGIVVVARSVADSNIILKDTTDSKGSFAFQLKEQGYYGISAKTENLAYYDLVNYKGEALTIDASLKDLSSFSGNIVLSGNNNLSGNPNDSIQITIPGSPWNITSNAEGFFVMDSIPIGSYYIYVRSPDQTRFNDVYYYVSLSSDSYSYQGPLPISLNINDSIEIKNNLNENLNLVAFANWTIPMSSEYGLVGWWPMTYLSQDSSSIRYLSDARGRTDVGVVYGKAFLDSGVLGQSIVLRGSNDFVVIESDRGVLDSAKALTLESWIYIEDLNETEDLSNYRKNLIGKVGFGNEDDQSIFSLALIKNECSVGDSSVLAFFISDGSGKALDCENAVFDSHKVIENQWIYTTSVWDGQKLFLYVNGILVASRDVSVDVLLPSIESLYFGKENLNFKLDEVRWSTVAVSASDVLYRYYNQGGIQ